MGPGHRWVSVAPRTVLPMDDQRSPLPPMSDVTTGEPGLRSLHLALTDVASPRRRSKPTVRYPHHPPSHAARPRAPHPQRSRAGSNAPASVVPAPLRPARRDPPDPEHAADEPGPRTWRQRRQVRPNPVIDASLRQIIDDRVVQGLGPKTIWVHLMDDHEISVSYTSIDSNIRGRQITRLKRLDPGSAKPLNRLPQLNARAARRAASGSVTAVEP